MKKHDITILEGYWTRYEELKKELDLPDKNENQARKNNMKTIVEGLRRVYESAAEDIKTIIHMRYWDEEDNLFEWADIADELDYSISKTLRKRKRLLEMTAKEIGFVL
nr:hypothetical protein [Fredinandcohnia onubensis]